MTAWTPSDLGAAFLAGYRADVSGEITSSSNIVSQWSDWSGNGFHAVQTNSANRPTYGANALATGKPGITFGANLGLGCTLSGVSGGTLVQAFAVGKLATGAPGFGRLVSLAASGVSDADLYIPLLATGSSDGFGAYQSSVGFLSQASIANDTAEVFTSLATSSQNTVYLNGLRRNQAAVTYPATAPTLLGIGNEADDLASGFAWGGPVSEVVLVTGSITKLQREHVEGYLAWKWDLQSNLPTALTSSDISSPPTWSGADFGGVLVVVYKDDGTLRGTSSAEATSGTVAWPSGTEAGDSALILIVGNNACALSGTGWNNPVPTTAENTGGSNFTVWTKAAHSFLAAAPVSGGNQAAGVTIGQGGTPLLLNTSATGTSSGFTKSSNSTRVVSLVVSRTGSTLTAGAPSGFTKQAQADFTYFMLAVADIDSASYTDGADIVWTGLGGGSGTENAVCNFEVDYTAAGGSVTVPGSTFAASASAFGATGQPSVPTATVASAAGSVTAGIAGTVSVPAASGSMAAGSFVPEIVLGPSSASAASSAGQIIASIAPTLSVASIASSATGIVASVAPIVSASSFSSTAVAVVAPDIPQVQAATVISASAATLAAITPSSIATAPIALSAGNVTAPVIASPLVATFAASAGGLSEIAAPSVTTASLVSAAGGVAGAAAQAVLGASFASAASGLSLEVGYALPGASIASRAMDAGFAGVAEAASFATAAGDMAISGSISGAAATSSAGATQVGGLVHPNIATAPVTSAAFGLIRSIIFAIPAATASSAAAPISTSAGRVASVQVASAAASAARFAPPIAPSIRTAPISSFAGAVSAITRVSFTLPTASMASSATRIAPTPVFAVASASSSLLAGHLAVTAVAPLSRAQAAFSAGVIGKLAGVPLRSASFASAAASVGISKLHQVGVPAASASFSALDVSTRVSARTAPIHSSAGALTLPVTLNIPRALMSISAGGFITVVLQSYLREPDATAFGTVPIDGIRPSIMGTVPMDGGARPSIMGNVSMDGRPQIWATVRI